MKEPGCSVPCAAIGRSFLLALALLTASCGVEQVAPGAQCFSELYSECAPGLECLWKTDGSDEDVNICSKECEGFNDCTGVGFRQPECKRFGLKSLCVEQEQADAGATGAH